MPDSPKKPLLQNYIILPTRGIQPTESTTAFFSALKTGVALNSVVRDDLPPEAVVLDSTRDTGAKLVQLPEDVVAEVRAAQPGLRIVPEVFYQPQRYMPVIRVQARQQAQAPKAAVQIQFVDKVSGQPIQNAYVVAFTNFEQRVGEGGNTDAEGKISFKSLGGQTIEQLYVYPAKDYWSLWRRNLKFTNKEVFKLQPVKLDYVDAKRYFYPTPAETDGTGVRVGIIDTGVGPHPNLTVAGGLCTVTGENPDEYTDVDQHGSHVAGIVAARAPDPKGMWGVAPGVDLYAYRVFGKNSQGASNFAIIKAIEQAVADGCDVINMSLGGGSPDEATQDAITYAFDHGTIAFVATGNDGRQPVSFPASFSLSLAVGAMGRKGTFPANTTDAPNVAAPYGTDPKNFVAEFSNIGPEVDFIAPGVGILSTVPGGYAPMSGTSMACPMATGAAARLLATQPETLNLPRSSARSEAFIKFLTSKVKSMGFGAIYEGQGLIPYEPIAPPVV